MTPSSSTISPGVITMPDHGGAPGPWWRELNRYHWFVLIVSALGWLFDTMDQQLFNLARVPAKRALLKPDEDVPLFSGYATAIFLIGWATGGLTKEQPLPKDKSFVH
jgi:hypothetical protein